MTACIRIHKVKYEEKAHMAETVNKFPKRRNVKKTSGGGNLKVHRPDKTQKAIKQPETNHQVVFVSLEFP